MNRPSGPPAVRFVTVLVVLTIVAWGSVGAAIASGQSPGSYAVRQGDLCIPITPLSDDEPVMEFYGYESTFEDNPSTTSIGPSFSSLGTLDLQVPETSLLFLYQGPEGNLSVVMVHGSREGGVDGGSASFNLTGLPADGRWTVKDDDYDSPENEDTWAHDETTAEIDWTWSRSATDGGAFEGLGDEFNVTIDPAFNGEAELFGQTNFGVVENWTMLSGDRDSPNRTSLDLEENVTISTEPCSRSVATSDDETTGTATPSGADGGDDRAEADDDEDEDDDRGRGNDDGRGDGPPFGDDDRDRGEDNRGDGSGDDRDRDRDRDDDRNGDRFPSGDDDDDRDDGDEDEDDDADEDDDEDDDDDEDGDDDEDDDDDEDGDDDEDDDDDEDGDD